MNQEEVTKITHSGIYEFRSGKILVTYDDKDNVWRGAAICNHWTKFLKAKTADELTRLYKDFVYAAEADDERTMEI